MRGVSVPLQEGRSFLQRNGLQIDVCTAYILGPLKKKANFDLFPYTALSAYLACIGIAVKNCAAADGSAVVFLFSL